MTFHEQYPALFQLFVGYFAEADFDGLTEEEVMADYLADSLLTEREKALVEIIGLLLDPPSWAEAAGEANRYFVSPQEQRVWLRMVQTGAVQILHRALPGQHWRVQDALIAILAAIAKQERVRLSERIKTGQARSNKKPGRPALAATKLAEVRRLRGQGLSFKQIQLATGVPVGTMHKYLVLGGDGAAG